MKKGFTLIELLMVVLIIAVLTSIALPQYMRSIERSRATEAMANLKALNDAVYAYAAGRTGENACPNSFKQLVVTIGNQNMVDASVSDTVVMSPYITTRDFKYYLNKATNAYIPGTDCPGVVAVRNSKKFDYKIWNPYTIGTSGEGSSLACYSDQADSKAICESLAIYKAQAPF